ncbi:MAG: NAD-dependent epimerase/dehydratase family protein [Candidatus Kuenenia sp.]|nr:NAD-dependent epimerase/dehydratase family protein [Candidatus Kuenenia hertensis]
MPNKALFLTGVTGFVGSNLLQRFSTSPVYRKLPVFVLARKKGQKTAVQRVKELIPDFSGKVIEGDICLPGLGIGNEDRKTLGHYDLEVWHVAGNIKFSGEEASEIYQVNLHGTGNVLQFVKYLSVKQFHYMSTAYVAGDRTRLLNGSLQTALEEEADVGQRFRNPYEKSKLQAEMLVRDITIKLGLKTNIYRIGIAVGRSDTGAATAFTGYYNYMMGFKALRDKISNNLSLYGDDRISLKNGVLNIPLRICGSVNATLNVGCIDYIVDIVVRLAENPGSTGKTFHIVNPNPPKFNWLLDTSLKIIQLEGIQIMDSDALACEYKHFPVTKLEERISRMIKQYLDYTCGEPVFDNSNVKKILGAVPAHPKVDEALIERLLSYAMKVNFGKERPQSV